ncbi:MAG: hypothetical protein BIFFINMI_00988 [Phycisphaerae bacterium]|nr:hypothetical protein [Phycisphaerae bacterium]
MGRKRLAGACAAGLVGALMLLPGCKNKAPTVDAEFAAFDRAYIPALAATASNPSPAYTPAQRQADANRAMARLNDRWHLFGNAFAGLKPDDPQWAADFDRVGKQIVAASKLLSDGKSADAHAALESVRQTFMALRGRNGIGYYLDPMTAFHEPMESIVKAATLRPGRTKLSPADLVTIRSALAKARLAWTDVTETTFDPEPFGFDAQRAIRLKLLVDAETASLDHLRDVLTGSDQEAIRQAALGIKTPFAQAYMLFGDFNGLKTVGH